MCSTWSFTLVLFDCDSRTQSEVCLGSTHFNLRLFCLIINLFQLYSFLFQCFNVHQLDFSRLTLFSCTDDGIYPLRILWKLATAILGLSFGNSVLWDALFSNCLVLPQYIRVQQFFFHTSHIGSVSSR